MAERIFGKIGGQFRVERKDGMGKLRILIDMDGVVVDTMGRLDQIHYDSAVGIENVTEWDISKFYPEKRGVFNFFNLPDIFSKADPIDGAVVSINKLFAAGHEVIFVTAVPIDSLNGYHQKIHWIYHYFGFANDNFVATHRKDLIDGDILIDDKPENIGMWIEAHPGGRAILFPQPWNGKAGWENHTKVWEDLVREIIQ